MPPAARITDMHTCPMATPGTPPIPHVGGPVISGAPTVIVAGMPQARISDQCTCVGPPDVIVKGSATVLVAGMPAARLGDMTAHGGVITTGAPNVLIGEAGTGGAVSLSQAMPGAPAAPGAAGEGPPPVDRPAEAAAADGFVSDLDYEWNPAKATQNMAKHGVPFEAVNGFDWRTAIEVEDTRYDYGETRMQALGKIEGRYHVLVYTLRGARIRVISLRKANRKEIP